MRCNRKKLAELLGRDVKTIDKMVAQGLPFVQRPGDPPGSKVWEFDTAAVIAWVSGARTDLDEKLHDAKGRILAATADLRRLEYLEAVGILRPIDDVMPGFEEALINIKANLYNIPGRAAQLVAYETDADKVRALLQREVDIAFRPADDFLAELEELAAQARKAEDAIARDPHLSSLLPARSTKEKGSGSD